LKRRNPLSLSTDKKLIEFVEDTVDFTVEVNKPYSAKYTDEKMDMMY